MEIDVNNGQGKKCKKKHFLNLVFLGIFPIILSSIPHQQMNLHFFL